MKLKKIRNWLKTYFDENGIEPDEVDKMLCEVLKVDFSKLIFLEDISLLDYLKIKHYAKVRKNGKPLTKIFHTAYFYGEKFFVNTNVLSPRQETELLVEKVLNEVEKLKKEKQQKISQQSSEKTDEQKSEQKNDIAILDLCTGSGAIAVTLSQKLGIKVFASDISSKALEVAKINAKKLFANVEFSKSDMFENINQKFDIIVSNPPYIETEICKTLDREVKNYDPIISLDGGIDGLDYYRVIASQSAGFLNSYGKVFIEIGYNQRKAVEQLFLDNNFDTICYKDYSGCDRIIVATKK